MVVGRCGGEEVGQTLQDGGRDELLVELWGGAENSAGGDPLLVVDKWVLWSIWWRRWLMRLNIRARWEEKGVRSHWYVLSWEPGRRICFGGWVGWASFHLPLCPHPSPRTFTQDLPKSNRLGLRRKQLRRASEMLSQVLPAVSALLILLILDLPPTHSTFLSYLHSIPDSVHRLRSFNPGSEEQKG